MSAQRTTDDVLAGVDLRGRTVVVTGPLSGLGFETSRALAKAGARVVLAGRGDDRLVTACDRLRGLVPDVDLDHVDLDLASLAAVREAATRLRGRLDHIDVLVNNAGVMFTPEGRTVDGFELQIGINHLGHFLLTRLLEPLLLDGAGSRVVTVGSGGHRLGDIDLDDPLWERRPYDKFAAYGASKTANNLFTVEFQRRYADRGTQAFVVHPGMVRTDLRRHMEADDVEEMMRRAAALATPERPAPVLRRVDVEEGAATTVWAATAPELDGLGGTYLADCAVSDDAAPHSLDQARAQRLWELSDRLVGLERL